MANKIYKKFTIIFFLSITFLLFFIMLFNYFVDPGNQFSHGASIEHRMAEALLQNKKVIVQANYNERLLQKMMLEKMTVQPDIFVLGSSHIMALTHNSFGANRFFNAGVSSASLQDDIALYYLLQKKGFQPKTIIICLDPWIVSKSNPETLWKTEYLKQFIAGKNLILGKQLSLGYFVRISSFFEKYSQLLSSAYLESSISDFFSTLSPTQNIRIFSAHPVVCPNCFVRQPDGSRLPTPNEESETPEGADTYVIDNANNWKSFWSQSKLSVRDTLLFEAFVDYLVKHNVRVVFYFPPLEPLEYQQLVKKNKNYKMVLIAQTYFKGIAKKYHAQIIGSYNPEKVHLTTKYFIDSWHMKEEGLQKLFRSAKNLKVYK